MTSNEGIRERAARALALYEAREAREQAERDERWRLERVCQFHLHMEESFGIQVPEGALQFETDGVLLRITGSKVLEAVVVSECGHEQTTSLPGRGTMTTADMLIILGRFLANPYGTDEGVPRTTCWYCEEEGQKDALPSLEQSMEEQSVNEQDRQEIRKFVNYVKRQADYLESLRELAEAAQDVLNSDNAFLFQGRRFNRLSAAIGPVQKALERGRRP
jgi:hypothetical protein